MQNKFIKSLATSGVSVSIANLATMPMDTTKVRMQLAHVRAEEGTVSPGLLRTGMNIIKEEGVLAFWNGSGPAVLRGLFYGGVRLGCYQPVKEAMGATKENPSFLRNVAAGSLSGGIAAAATNPIDLMKTRMQSKGNKHKTISSVVRNVVQTDGVSGLWRGTVPSATRAAVLTASQCATYDEIKTLYMRYTGAKDSFMTHLASSMVTGLVTTTATAPVDVIKTNMFMGGSKFKGPIDCATEIIKREGPRGLLRGWTAQYVRLGPQTTVIFVVMEKMRKWAKLESLGSS